MHQEQLQKSKIPFHNVIDYFLEIIKTFYKTFFLYS